MAAWLTVYCTHSVDHLTAADILAVFHDIDFFTVAEGFGIEDEEVVRQALEQLAVEPVTEPDGVKYQLRYHPPEYRPVLIHLSRDPTLLQSLREEALDDLKGKKGKGPNRVRSHLDLVIEIASLELGWSQLEDMGIVLAGQVAEYLATVGVGLIRDQNDDWWAVEDRVPVLLIGPKRRA